ncbi:MAG: MotA/TolQ/ExbB proton channel family protein [Planctomycetota bacterium]
MTPITLDTIFTQSLVVLAQAEEAASGEAADRSLFDYVLQGREVGFLIILLSVAAVGLIIAQYVLTQAQRLAPDEHAEQLASRLQKGDVKGAIQYCGQDDVDSMLTRTVGAALTKTQRSAFGILELSEAVEESGREQVARLSRGIDAVGLVATIAPMLGLLGTVVGILGAFDTLSITQGPPRPADMAGDISAALVTTVLGLIVAIPCTAAHTFLRNRLESASHEVGEVIEQLMAPLQARAGGSPQRTAAPAPAARPAAPAAAPRPQQGAPAAPKAPPPTQPRPAGGTA